MNDPSTAGDCTADAGNREIVIDIAERGRSGKVTVSKNIGTAPETNVRIAMISPIVITANRTRAVISPNQAPQALARRQPHGLVGPQV